MSHIYKESIIHYLPKNSSKDNYYISNTNGSVACLRNEYLKTDSLFDRELLWCGDAYYKMADCVVIDHIRAAEVYKLLQMNKHLFLPPEGIRPEMLKTRFGIDVVYDALPRLLSQALENVGAQAESLAFIEDDRDLSDNISPKYLQSCKFNLSVQDIYLVSKYENIWKLLKEESLKATKCNPPRPFISVCLQNGCELRCVHDGFQQDECINDDDLDLHTKSLLQKVCFHYVTADLLPDEYLMSFNAVVLARKDPFGSFCNFCSQLDPTGLSAVRMNLRHAYVRFDKITNGEIPVSDDEYLTELIKIRKNVKEALGNEPYRNYSRLIQQTGIDSSRFINELLQNADDLEYASGTVPTFEITEVAGGIRSCCNETGFSRKNVRAITAIGESTKKKIMDDELRSVTGEKGIGFKSVFSVFSHVQIDSGVFHFYLTREEPTIPTKIGGNQTTPGTAMLFTDINRYYGESC